MKDSIAFLLVCFVHIASAVPVEETKVSRGPYPRFIKFPGGNGTLHDVDLDAEPDTEVLNQLTRDPANNEYFLYTRHSLLSQTLVMNDADSILNSNFNPNVSTVVIVHGWQSTRSSEPNPTIRAAYLTKSDVNVIVMEWSQLATGTFVTATYGVPAVGRGLGQFIAFLSSVTGAGLDSIHLVGFNLGAHLVGNAGRELRGRVARVTGLDPAGPLWSHNSNRIQPSDGMYVEAIHTDGGHSVGGLGIGLAVADVDFFPNGGISQPGCLTNPCNHNRAWELFAASVTYNHLIGQRCASTLQVSWNTCRGVSLHLGNDDLTKTGVSGMYRLDTGRRYPF